MQQTVAIAKTSTYSRLTARILQIHSLGFGLESLPLEFDEDFFHLERMHSKHKSDI